MASPHPRRPDGEAVLSAAGGVHAAGADLDRWADRLTELLEKRAGGSLSDAELVELVELAAETDRRLAQAEELAVAVLALGREMASFETETRVADALRRRAP